jgi:hypothetical protein
MTCSEISPPAPFTLLGLSLGILEDDLPRELVN